MSSSVVLSRRSDLTVLRPDVVTERRLRRTAGLSWAMLLLNVMTFFTTTWSGLPLVLPIPSIVGKLITQGALPLAFLLALAANRRMLIKPNAYLCIVSLLAAEAFMVVLEPGHIGTLYRTFRFAGFIATLWLLSPWWGRRDLLLVRSHLMTISAVVGTVLLGILASPGTALAQGRLEGAFWPFPPTQVAHFAAVMTGLVILLWLSGLVRGYLTLAVAAVGVVTVLLTHTRTALVAMLAGLLVGGLSLFRARARVRKVFAGATIAISVGAITLSSFVTSWLVRGEGTHELTSLTGRTTIWTQVLATPRTEFQQIFGFGLSDLSFNGQAVDSNWLGAYLDLGLVGITLSAAMLLFLLVSAYFQPLGPQRALALFLVTYCLISSFTETGLSDASLYLLELTLAASMLVSRPDPVGPTSVNASRPAALNS